MAITAASIKKATKVSKKLRCLITGLTGSGKAQPMTSKLLTPTGWITMADVEVGTELVNPEGGTTKVTSIHQQGVIPTYKFEFSDGSITHACGNHLWKCQDLVDRAAKRWRVLTTKQILEEGLQTHYGRYKFYVPMANSVEFTTTLEDLPVHPYLLGCLLGDGGLSTSSVIFTNTDPNMVEAVTKLVPEGITVIPTDGISYRLSSGNNGRPNPLVTMLREMGLQGTKSDTKFVPEEYLYTTKECRQLLLAGLLDTDGYSKGATIEYCTTSPHLSEAVIFLVKSLGGTVTVLVKSEPTFRYKGELKTGKLAYRLFISLPRGINPFLHSHKKESFTPKTKYTPFHQIKSIEYNGEEKCQCITVDSDNNLYVTDDFVVTHNSTSSLLLAKGLTNNGKVLVLDTENGRASLKVGLPVLEGFEYDVIEVASQDVTSEDYIKAIELAEQNGYDAVILDSATHEWEYVKELQQKLGGRYTDWGKAKAGHHKFIKKVISAKVHVIITARSDIKHEQQEVNGRKQVVKLGLGTQQNSNFPYEMDFVFDIQDRSQNTVCDKSEGGLFSEPLFTITPATGALLAQYLADGVDPDTETKKKYAARIRELESELLAAGAFSDEELKTIEERDPDHFLSMAVGDLQALGVSLGSRVKALAAV